MHSYSRVRLGGQRRVMPPDDARLSSGPAVMTQPFLPSLASSRLAQRYGLSPTAAATIASLAGLGPQEVRQ